MRMIVLSGWCMIQHMENLKDQQKTNKISNCINMLEAKDVLCGGQDDAQIWSLLKNLLGSFEMLTNRLLQEEKKTLLQVSIQLYGKINSLTAAASLSAHGSTGLERFNAG
ncbi:hypothetical protein F441_08518 [Phytophthora nicotianae CJ01A1]|uniref:Uncharacterized protein n=3 Tax=Phytophthora nicotianae TaxID=4792 RepID=W2X395_PHYNI|nr:hypothetical protein F441_08518 [Phytophthora nicotianae CJ01A1]